MAKGILYVMTTVVPGLIKIGKTGSTNFESRMYTLERNGYANVTGLHRRFAIEVEDYEEKEELLDTIFSKSNVIGTELFAIDVDLVIQLLSSFDGTVIYPEAVNKENVFDDATDNVEKRKEDAILGRTPSGKARRFRFSMVGIPVGAEITYTRNHSIKAEVIDDTHVIYKGKNYSMSALAKELNGRTTATQGTLWFEYKGKKLTDLRKEKEME